MIREFFESPYFTNLLLFSAVFLLLRIARILRDTADIKRAAELTLQIAHENAEYREELVRLFRFLVEEQVKARDTLHTIKNLEETIVRRMPSNGNL